jgi:prophage regulatory protein
MVKQQRKDNMVSANSNRKPSMPQIIRLPEVQRLTGLSKSTVYAKMNSKSPYFDLCWPKRVSLGPRSVGWYRHEIIEWVESRTSSSVWGV